MNIMDPLPELNERYEEELRALLNSYGEMHGLWRRLGLRVKRVEFDARSSGGGEESPIGERIALGSPPFQRLWHGTAELRR